MSRFERALASYDKANSVVEDTIANPYGKSSTAIRQVIDKAEAARLELTLSLKGASHPEKALGFMMLDTYSSTIPMLQSILKEVTA